LKTIKEKKWAFIAAYHQRGQLSFQPATTTVNEIETSVTTPTTVAIPCCAIDLCVQK
jgi:hypothetical protein